MKKIIKLRAEIGKVYINVKNGIYVKNVIFVPQEFESEWVQIAEQDVIPFKQNVKKQKVAAKAEE